VIHLLLRKLAGAFLVALLLLTTAGCGRRGPLEPPPAGAPDSQATPAPGQSSENQSNAAQAVNPPPPSPDAAKNEIPGSTQPQPNHPGTVKPVLNSFPLDPLLN